MSLMPVESDTRKLEARARVWAGVERERERERQRMCACLVSQQCLTLCDPMDCSPQGSSVYEILQARILEWVAIPFSWGSSQPRDRTRRQILYCLSQDLAEMKVKDEKQGPRLI